MDLNLPLFYHTCLKCFPKVRSWPSFQRTLPTEESRNTSLFTYLLFKTCSSFCLVTGMNTDRCYKCHFPARKTPVTAQLGSYNTKEHHFHGIGHLSTGTTCQFLRIVNSIFTFWNDTRIDVKLRCSYPCNSSKHGQLPLEFSKTNSLNCIFNTEGFWIKRKLVDWTMKRDLK